MRKGSSGTSAASKTSLSSHASSYASPASLTGQRTWRSNLAHDAHAGPRIGKVHQWPPPKPEDEQEASIGLDNPTKVSHLQTNRGRGEICIDTRLDNFGGGNRKPNARGRIEPTVPAPATSTSEEVALDPACLKHTVKSIKAKAPKEMDFDEQTPFAGLNALRSRQQDEPPAHQYKGNQL